MSIRSCGQMAVWQHSPISRAQFELRPTIRPEAIERRLAHAQTGYAWGLILDHMYKAHAGILRVRSIDPAAFQQSDTPANPKQKP